MSLYRRGGVLFGIILAIFFLMGARPQDQSKKDDAKSAPAEKAGNGKVEKVNGDPAKGKQLFENNCSICHEVTDEDKVGPGLKGIFQKGPHKLSDGTEHKEHTVAVIRKQIVEGGGSMPPVGSALSEQDVNDLIAYLQTL